MRINSIGWGISVIVFCLMSVVLVNCARHEDPAPVNSFTPPPTITSIAPQSGFAGDVIVITGENFGIAIDSNEVSFNTITAIIRSASDTRLEVIVPVDATTGKVTVTTRNRNAVSDIEFEVLEEPGSVQTIESFSPEYGVPGEVITIRGTGFQPDRAELYRVTIRGTFAEVTSVTETEVKFIVPATAETGALRIFFSTQVGSAGTFEVLKDIPRNGLVAFYPFQGNTNDESGHALNGIPHGPMPVNDRYGKPDAAYLFDGIDDFIFIGNDADVQISPSITIGAWVKLSGTPRVSNLVSKLGEVDNEEFQGYVFHCYKDGLVDAYSHGLVMTGANGGILTSGAWAPEQWTFVAITQNGDHASVYLNDQKIADAVGQRSLNSIDVSKGDLIIGKGIVPGLEDFFRGAIDDLIIYNRALSAEEILQVYHQTLTTH